MNQPTGGAGTLTHKSNSKPALLGEPPTALQAAGLVTVLSGFYLAQRQR
jgi:hypothetical protein